MKKKCEKHEKLKYSDTCEVPPIFYLTYKNIRYVLKHLFHMRTHQGCLP